MMNIRSVTLEEVVKKIVKTVTFEISNVKKETLNKDDNVIGEFVISDGIKFLIFVENINRTSRKLYTQAECKLDWTEKNIMKENINETMKIVCDELRQIGYNCYFKVEMGRWTVVIHGSSEAL